MLTMTPKGLYCQAGNFHIDPMGSVDTAIITHAHSDHARRGSKKYFCARPGVELLKARIGKKFEVQGVPYGQEFYVGPVKVSFHSAGHILGSAQVRMEYFGEVWVASGDYKREFDPTCDPFEVVPCDVFITEATFGTPKYIWNRSADLGTEIHSWWTENAKQGLNSILFAYSLGKTQRILGLLKDIAHRPIYCHPAATTLNECYLSEGIKLAKTICLSTVPENTILEGEFIVAPQSFLNSSQSQILGQNFQTAFASGWMATRDFEYSKGGDESLDKGFVISDHADWNDLVETIKQTKARKIYVQHRGRGALVKHLKGLGFFAFPDSDLPTYDQLAFF